MSPSALGLLGIYGSLTVLGGGRSPPPGVVAVLIINDHRIDHYLLGGW